MKLIIATFFITTLIPSLVYAEQSIHHDKANKSVPRIESLSPQLRTLLTQEMRALQNGMQAIIPAYVSGNWEDIEQIADKMQNSYILKQNITDEQKKELHASLSVSFITLDQHFHYLAGMLKHAAKNKKTELIGFYFSKLSDTCVNCHSQYATHKFPKFNSHKQINTHPH